MELDRFLFKDYDSLDIYTSLSLSFSNVLGNASLKDFPSAVERTLYDVVNQAINFFLIKDTFSRNRKTGDGISWHNASRRLKEKTRGLLPEG